MVSMENINSEISSLSLPEPSKEGLESFLASPYIPGIGKVFASRIVENIGNRILDPGSLTEKDFSEIPGLSESKAKTITESLKSLRYSPRLLAFLYSCGLNDTDIEKITSHYRKHTEDVILYDPYEMVEDVWKFSFFKADKIGKALGIKVDDPRRLRGALLTAVKIYAENGSMFATTEEALATASRITGVEEEKFLDEIENLVKDERLIKSHHGLYLPVYYKAEKEGAEKIASLIRSSKDLSEDLVLPETDREGNTLSSDQLHAIETVMKNPVTIITGGPGTGKTTTIRGIISLLEERGKNVVLAAPTGRAAKRMTDLTGTEAKTIHRLLGYRQGEGHRNKHFDADILIIDEASMMEQVLFNHLLQALKPGTKVVMVGDIDQLPAIGAGDVLRDLINSGTVPVISLNENFRQKNGSMIASNARAIKEGCVPENIPGSDFTLISEESPKKIHDRILSLVSEEIPAHYHIDPKDIQVVSPQQEGPLGAKQLNLDIQKCVNPTGPEVKRGLKTFRLGDRVMQTSNSSERHTYNGETGWVSPVDPENQTLEVTFYDGKHSSYNRKELGELSLAYATTVHKLQGSETEYMVMPMTMSHKPMLYRNLLYTGVSRAKKMCVLVGEDKAIRTAIENKIPSTRNSNFKKRLQENINPLKV